MSGDTQTIRPGELTGSPGRSAVLARLRSYLNAHYARVLFIAVFLIPTLGAVIYFGLIASDRYISEARFIVRSVEKPAAEGAAAFLQDFGITRANDDTFAIQDYIHSRDAMQAIMKKIDLREVWGREDADFWSRYGGDSDEDLFRYYQGQVKVEKNAETGITTVKVSAFRAQDAHAILQMILLLSEKRINEMNLRARRDSLALAEEGRASAARNLAEATVALSSYRNATELIDPAETAVAAVDRNAELTGELARLQVTLQTMVRRAPENPAIPALRQRIAALSAELEAQEGRLTGARDSLSGKVGIFERLEIERELAEKNYEEAQRQFDRAREEADRQRVYIESIAAPNVPDVPTEPRRMRYMFTVALLSLWAFLIFYLLVSGSREHLNVS